MFNNNPSAPAGWTGPSNAFIPAKSSPNDLLIFSLSLPLRQRLISNLNAFSQLLHGKPTSKIESDELTSESQRLVVQLMSLRVRSNEERLMARINENAVKPPVYPLLGLHGESAKAFVTTTTSSMGAPFGTHLVCEISWSERERIINRLVANLSLAIVNKTQLTEASKNDLLRENDEMTRTLSSLPTRPTNEPIDTETLGDSLDHLKIGGKSAENGQLSAELENKLKQRDSHLEFRLNEIVSNMEKDRFNLSGLVHNVQTRLNLVEAAMHRVESESVRKVDERIKSYLPCTFKRTGRTHVDQPMFNCITCKFEGGKVTCSNCIEICHKGHNTKLSSNRGFCDCGSGEYNFKCELC